MTAGTGFESRRWTRTRAAVRQLRRGGLDLALAGALVIPLQGPFPGAEPGGWQRAASWLTAAVLLALVVEGSRRLVRTLDLEGAAERLTAGLMLAAAQVTLPELALGHVRLLTPALIVAAQTLV